MSAYPWEGQESDTVPPVMRVEVLPTRGPAIRGILTGASGPSMTIEADDGRIVQVYERFVVSITFLASE